LNRAGRCHATGRTQEGQALVEFALVAPLLLLLLIGIFDAAVGLNAYVTISNASVEAVRYATAHPDKDIDTIRTSAVITHSQQLNTSGPVLSLTGSYGTATPAATWPSSGIPQSSPAATRIPIRMTVTYDWGSASVFFGGLFTRLLGASPTFSATASGETVR
jgi:Flp pilus assembly protein TadG